MSISEKYRFSDFTISNYKEILKLAIKCGYNFSYFKSDNSYFGKTIILRHDIEFSVNIALEMAEIEHNLGIKSTYFVQLHGDFYNALESRTFNQIKKIESFGHELGLHFDVHYWNINDTQILEEKMLIDKETFSKYFGRIPRVFSFHNNNNFTLACTDNNYCGMINAYGGVYQNSYGYCSDSTGFWRYEVLEDRIKQDTIDVLQILIHDAMWQNEIMSPRSRVFRVIDNHAEFMKQSYDDTLIRFGATNVDWDGPINI